MRRDTREKVDVDRALEIFGGFVRYYDTTEPLLELSDIVSSSPCQDVLVCCGGGNQAMTMLGAATAGFRSLCAVDINSSQLFILAAKICFLKRHGYLPSFDQLQHMHSGKIASVKKDVRRLEQMRLCHILTGKPVMLPRNLGENYSVVVKDPMFVVPDSGPFWLKDPAFIERICGRSDCLKLAQIDIFDSHDYFNTESLDLIYLSDIYWQEELEYFTLKLARLINLLRPQGRIITYLDPGDDFMGKGVSPGQVLLNQAKELALKVVKRQNGGYLIFERRGGDGK